MAVVPADFLATAHSLKARQQASECDLRAATSRAFYAALHHCLGWHASLPQQGKNVGPSGGGTHQELINRLEHPDPMLVPSKKQASKKAAKQLLALRVRRVDADYKLGLTPTIGETTDQIVQAERLLRELR